MRLVFFSRCLPEGFNAVKVAVKARQIFIGWPAVHTEPERGKLRSCIHDISDPDWDSNTISIEGTTERLQYRKNCRFAAQVESGDIALIPSAPEGLIYGGRVKSGFNLHDDPEWSEEYLNEIKKQGADISKPAERLVQVAQSCEVDFFRPLPYASVPAWIRRSLFGRSTYGRVAGLPGLDAFDFLDDFIDSSKTPSGLKI